MGDQYCLKGTPPKCDNLTHYRLDVYVHCRPRVTIPVRTVDMTENKERLRLEIKTMVACPVTCPIVNGELCNGHGMCGWDYDNYYVHCYCNSAYKGSSCTESKILDLNIRSIKSI